MLSNPWESGVRPTTVWIRVDGGVRPAIRTLHPEWDHKTCAGFPPFGRDLYCEYLALVSYSPRADDWRERLTYEIPVLTLFHFLLAANLGPVGTLGTAVEAGGAAARPISMTFFCSLQ